MPLPPPRTVQALRRVVVTGIGAVSPLGANTADAWRGVLEGKTGARRVAFNGDDFACAPVDAPVVARPREKALSAANGWDTSWHRRGWRRGYSVAIPWIRVGTIRAVRGGDLAWALLTRLLAVFASAKVARGAREGTLRRRDGFGQERESS